jgi:hypothetical protein
VREDRALRAPNVLPKKRLNSYHRSCVSPATRRHETLAEPAARVASTFLT